MKAIETFYNGYKFRSRLEARWAVFFDGLNIPYEYEKVMKGVLIALERDVHKEVNNSNNYFGYYD